MNPTIFPSPSTFRPDRWLKGTKYNRELERYLVNFGKGSRSCLGMKCVPSPSPLSPPRIPPFEQFTYVKLVSLTQSST